MRKFRKLGGGISSKITALGRDHANGIDIDEIVGPDFEAF